MKVSIV